MIVRKQRRRRLRLMNDDTVDVLNNISSSPAPTLPSKIRKRDPNSALPNLPVKNPLDDENVYIACDTAQNLDTEMQANYKNTVSYSVINEKNRCDNDPAD